MGARTLTCQSLRKHPLPHTRRRSPDCLALAGRATDTDQPDRGHTRPGRRDPPERASSRAGIIVRHGSADRHALDPPAYAHPVTAFIDTERDAGEAGRSDLPVSCGRSSKEETMETPTPYAINLNAISGPLEQIDVQALADACTDAWYNQTLCGVNDCVVRLGVMQGEFHWHKHDREDEFFYVVEGRFVIDLEGRTVELTPRQGFTIPKGVMHRTRAPERSVILMIEGAAVVPTGDK